MAKHPALVIVLLGAGFGLAQAQVQQFEPYELERASVGVYNDGVAAAENPAPVAKAPEAVAAPAAVTNATTRHGAGPSLEGKAAAKAALVPVGTARPQK